jgi:hypothetical protein
VRLVAALEGDLEAHMAAELKGAEEAVTGAVREAGEGLKRDWRAQVTAARLGQRLANTIRGQHYPKGRKSIAAAALVYSRAPRLIDAFDRGVTIRARNGLWLAIPTPAAGQARGGKRITPAEWEQRTGRRLRFVYRRGVPSLLVSDQARITKRGLAVASRSKTGRGAVTAPIFILVPQVHLRKRLDLDRATRHWESRLPELIVAKWREERT